MATDNHRSIATVEKTFSIVETLERVERARLTELAEELDMNKTTVYNHLKTLQSEELVIKEDDEYRLALRFLSFGGSVRRKLPLHQTVKPELYRITEQTAETATFMTEEFGRGVYLESVSTTRTRNIDIYPGLRVHLHASSLGKAILSELPEHRVEEIIEAHGLEAHTPQTITDRAEIYEELERIRERGFAVDDEEFMRGLRCVATPITEDDGSVLGAIGISAPTTQVDDARFFEEFPDIVRSSANVIHLNLD
jgi:DNA-binding IclR family transcriptional regulator